MKPILLSVLLALAFAGAASAADPTPESLDREVQELADDLRETKEKIADLQDRLDTVEKRLGDTYRPLSPFDSIERRLEDIEKDMDRIKR